MELKIREFEAAMVLWFYGSNGGSLHLELWGNYGKGLQGNVK